MVFATSMWLPTSSVESSWPEEVAGAFAGQANCEGGVASSAPQLAMATQQKTNARLGAIAQIGPPGSMLHWCSRSLAR